LPGRSLATRRTVLCVETIPRSRTWLEDALSAEGLLATVANSGASAMACARLQRPDALDAGPEAPDADGLSLCAHFHSQLDTAVIVLSGRHRR